MAEEWLHTGGAKVNHVPIRTFLGHDPELSYGRAAALSSEDDEPLVMFYREQRYVLDRVREQWPEINPVELSQTKYQWGLVDITRRWIDHLIDHGMEVTPWTTFKQGVYTTFVFQREEDAVLFKLMAAA